MVEREERMKKKKISIFDVVVYAIAIFLLVIVLYPLILVISNSVSDPTLVAKGEVLLLPKGINLDGYISIFESKELMTGYANTMYYTFLGTLINLVVTLPAGYVLSKPRVRGNKFFMGMFMVTMYFSGGLIPTFLLISNLGLYNSRWALLLPGAFSVYNCIVCRSFFAAIPKELEESAYIDGCSVIRSFMQIVMPLSKALLGVMVLYFAVDHWNSYFSAMIYIKDDVKMPLQVFLRRILVLAQSLSLGDDNDMAITYIEREALLRYSTIVVSSLPLMIIYPFLQKFFDKGVLIGSVKG